MCLLLFIRERHDSQILDLTGNSDDDVKLYSDTDDELPSFTSILNSLILVHLFSLQKSHR